VLSESPTVDELASRLMERPFRGRQLGALLLDQSFVAGLGNYLRAEILFEARIHPRRRAVDCAPDELARLAARAIALTRRTYRTRGITLPPSVVDQLKAAGLTRSAYRFWVYGRAGGECRLCGSPLEVASVGGRKCFWCPSCQPVSTGQPKGGRW
jgi:endonuclease-8